MKSAARLTAVAMCVMIALSDARGLRQDARSLRTKAGYQEVHFFEKLSGDDSVVVLEDGPFRFTASCKTVTYDFDNFYSSYSSSSPSSSVSSSSSSSFSSPPSDSNSFGQSPSSSYYHSTRTPGSFLPCHETRPTDSLRSSFIGLRGDDDFSFSDDDRSETTSMSHPRDPDMSHRSSSTPETSSSIETSSDPPSSTSSTTSSTTSTSSFTDPFPTTISSEEDYTDFTYTERFAALEMTYTAEDADFLFGSPAYSNYPNELALVGGYGAGESRTQTVFAGRDGAYGDMSTLQSSSGHYVTINGDSTIGIHKDWTYRLPGGNASFPDGVDCMLSGFISYVLPLPELQRSDR